MYEPIEKYFFSSPKMFCKNPSKPNKEIPPKKTAKAMLPEKIPKL